MKFPYLSISLIGFNSSYLEIITKLSIVPLFAGEIMAKNYAFISSHNSVCIVCQVSYATFFVEFETHIYTT